MKKGSVVLVGAGPGDEGLLTLSGAEAIKNADVVVYDRLVSASILALIPEDAEKINGGKNAGHHPLPQEEINGILLHKALEGKNVVRLKGGDSFVFGRGGEELEALAEHNIPFKIIPGITSGIAAAAYAGIPVTHRDFSSSLHIITGHKKANGALEIDYGALIGLDGTLVFLMAVASIGEIAQGLMGSGMAADMPCGVIENGTRTNQRKVISTLKNIEADVKKNGIKSPAVFIIGRVCSLSDRFDWFEKGPLKGVKVLVCNTKATSVKTGKYLRNLGAEVTELPVIETEDMPFEMPDLSRKRIGVFTSGAAVKSFFRQLYKTGMDGRNLSNLKFAVIGKETEKILFEYGIKADFVPKTYSSEALAKEMIDSGFCSSRDSFLLFRGDIASKDIIRVLEGMQAAYEEVIVYKTKEKDFVPIDMAGFQYIVFTSASGVHGFMSKEMDFNKRVLTAVCIGRQTEKAAISYGLKTVVSKEATIPSIAEKLEEICNEQ